MINVSAGGGHSEDDMELSSGTYSRKKILTLRAERSSFSAAVVALPRSVFLRSSGAGVVRSPLE